MKRKLAMELARQEEGDDFYYDDDDDDDGQYREDMPESSNNSSNNQNLNATILASKFAANTKRGVLGNQRGSSRIDPDDPTLKMPKMFKPEDPGFF